MSPQLSPSLLHSACEQCIACLRELSGIHLDIDPPTGAILPNAPHCVYGMRKVLLHVTAIFTWQVDTNVMHVIAPELRAANEQIDGFWDEAVRAMELDFLDGAVGPENRRARAFAKRRQELVSPFIHPTPARLLLPREDGGLAPASGSRHYYFLIELLADLAFRYAVSTAFLSQLRGADTDQAIVCVIHKIQKAIPAVSPGNSLTLS